MRFSITAITTIMAILTASGSAFVMDTYSDTSCGSRVQTGVNVWDSTCATWPKGFKSFKIRTWGGNLQKAYFFGPNDCGSLPGAITSGYVDRTTKNYKLGNCYTLGGAAANAVASYHDL